jgi:hypothetical protein
VAVTEVESTAGDPQLLLVHIDAALVVELLLLLEVGLAGERGSGRVPARVA